LYRPDSQRAPNGIRTRAAALKGRCPRPLDDGGFDGYRRLTRGARRRGPPQHRGREAVPAKRAGWPAAGPGSQAGDQLTTWPLYPAQAGPEQPDTASSAERASPSGPVRLIPVLVHQPLHDGLLLALFRDHHPGDHVDQRAEAAEDAQDPEDHPDQVGVNPGVDGQA
jgi:hypothetical protein